MSPSSAEVAVAGWLTHLPLASAREIAPFCDMSDAVVYRALGGLVDAGLANCVTAGVPLVPPSRRYWLTPAGIRLVASAKGTTTDFLLKWHPISGEWLRTLLRRLDAVIVIYQVAAAIAELYHVAEFCWYRTYPLDAGLRFRGGGSIAFHREGPLASLFHRRRRLYAIAEARIAPITLVLTTDEVRQRDWKRRMRYADLPGAIAVEDQFLADPWSDAALWLRADRNAFGLEPLGTAVRELIGTRIPDEIPFKRVSPPPALLARDRRAAGARTRVTKEYELPLLLAPLEKRVIDLVAAWPLLTTQDLAGFLGITRQGAEKALIQPANLGLVDRVLVDGYRTRRLVVSDRGLLMLARRDRLPTQHTLHQWSSTTRNGAVRFHHRHIRGVRMRALARSITHTASMCWFFAMLHLQARELGGHLVNVESHHRSWRGFADDRGYAGQLRPDGYFVYRHRDVVGAFFVEWERRADRPGRYWRKLWPYIRYYRSERAWDDARAWPWLLMVLRDAAAEDGFWSVARDELKWGDLAERLSILTTTEDMVLRAGPFGQVWRDSGVHSRWTLLRGAGVDP